MDFRYPGQFSFLDDDATVRFGPDAPLPFDAVVIVELTSGITDRFENPLVDSAGQSLVTPLTFTFLTGSFGITSPTNGSEVLESSALLLEAKATSSLNIATITFTVNGQALPAIAGPPFATTFNVGLASATPTLTIVATGRNASGAQVAQDQVVVTVVPGLRAVPRLLGVPLGATRQLRLGLASPLTTDLVIQLAVVDSAIATLSAPSIVLPAGQTEVAVPVTGVSIGATTITATSARGTTWAVASVSPAVTKTIGVDGSPVGIAVVPARLLGQVVTPVNGQTSIAVPILGAPAIVATAVDVTSSNPAVASVNGAVTISAGSRTANIVITTGVQGTATLDVPCWRRDQSAHHRRRQCRRWNNCPDAGPTRWRGGDPIGHGRPCVRGAVRAVDVQGHAAVRTCCDADPRHRHQQRCERRQGQRTD